MINEISFNEFMSDGTYRHLYEINLYTGKERVIYSEDTEGFDECNGHCTFNLHIPEHDLVVMYENYFNKLSQHDKPMRYFNTRTKKIIRRVPRNLCADFADEGIEMSTEFSYNPKNNVFYRRGDINTSGFDIIKLKIV